MNDTRPYTSYTFFFTQMYLIHTTSECLDPVICKISFRRKLHNEAFQATLQGQGCGAGGISRRAKACCSVGVLSVKLGATVETKFTLPGFKR